MVMIKVEGRASSGSLSNAGCTRLQLNLRDCLLSHTWEEMDSECTQSVRLNIEHYFWPWFLPGPNSSVRNKQTSVYLKMSIHPCKWWPDGSDNVRTCCSTWVRVCECWLYGRLICTWFEFICTQSNSHHSHLLLMLLLRLLLSSFVFTCFSGKKFVCWSITNTHPWWCVRSWNQDYYYVLVELCGNGIFSTCPSVVNWRADWLMMRRRI